MVSSKAKTVAEYLASLPADRRAIIEGVRQVALANLGEGYEEAIGYGMIGFQVPLSVYPAGYHCTPSQPLPFAGLAAQRNYCSLYMMGIYTDPSEAQWFQQAWRATGKKLDMGKSCIRFKRLEDVPLEVVAEAFRRMPAHKYIASYEAMLALRDEPRAAKRKVPTKPAAKKATKPVTKPVTKPAAKKATKPAAKKATKPVTKPAAKKAAKPATKKATKPATKEAARKPVAKAARQAATAKKRGKK
jgi:hypothetical protein